MTYMLFQMNWFELASEQVRVHRLVQQAGEFVVVYPRTFTASIACGYSISETIRFATPDWLPIGYEMTKVRMQCCCLSTCCLHLVVVFSLCKPASNRKCSASTSYSSKS